MTTTLDPSAFAGIQSFNPNPLVYPGGLIAPGFDPEHPASKQMLIGKQGLSAVARGNNFINLLNSKLGSVSGTNTPIFDHMMGPMVKIGASSALQFTGNATTGNQCTIAGIVVFTSSSNATFFSSGNANTTGVTVGSGGGAFFSVGNSGYFFPTDDGTPNGVPHFYALTVINTGGSNYNWTYLLKRLDTGQMWYQTGTATTTAFAPTGSFVIGCAGFPISTNIAAVMYSPVAMPVSALREWAADPWSFWYPRPAFDLLTPLAPVAGAPLFPSLSGQAPSYAKIPFSMGPLGARVMPFTASLPFQPVTPTAVAGTLPFMGVG